MAVVFAIRHGCSVLAPPRLLTHEKKAADIHTVNPAALALLTPEQVIVAIQQADEAEMDERWSFVGRKGCQRWLWQAIDHHSGALLAYVLGAHTDQVFLELQQLLAPFDMTRFYTDDWGTYQRPLTPDQQAIGKKYTQKIERKHLTLRTRIKRLARKTIGFSKSVQMHDIVIGLFVNRDEFGLQI